MFLGVDTGGTFTDFVVFNNDGDGNRLRVHKRLSTPHAPEQAILLGIKELGLTPETLIMIHGSTVATNAALEGKGVRTVYITNRGLGDMLTIGRQARRELYNLQPAPQPAPVPAELCLETSGRIAAGGEIIEALTKEDLQQLAAQIKALKPEAVAINLLFSFLNDEPEKAIEAIIPEHIFVSRSSEILPEHKEYERGITTWLNAWVGPLVEKYLQHLKQKLPQTQISVMQSSGGTIAAEQAGHHAVQMLLSGPAGGLAGALHIGQRAGHQHLLTFDMGGTSTDVALLDGRLRLTNEGHIGPYPVATPMVDMHTIGAGGGSIAYLDEGGLLHVGPQSAGAEPGPACYGRDGDKATVTDANLILGRLQADAFLGGRMQLDIATARAAIERLATPLQLSIEQTAAGIIRLANEHMAQALRLISIQKGFDPKQFTLMPFGGAGGLHVCALADALNMDSALVPVYGGVLSALGMLTARRSRELSRTIAMKLEETDTTPLQQRFVEMENQASKALAAEGVHSSDITFRRSADLRYCGQSFTLNIPWSALATMADAFHQTHQQRFGHRLQQAVELVNLRLQALGPEPAITLPQLQSTVFAEPRNKVTLLGIKEAVTVWEREKLAAGQQFAGPALITETVATTFIDRGWHCTVDSFGNLILKRERV